MKAEHWAGDDENGGYFLTINVEGVKPGTRGWKTYIDLLVREAQLGAETLKELAAADKAGASDDA